MSDRTPRPQPLLVARGIEKTYGAIRALRGVDLEVRPGEVLALVGENGAGKSTLGKILAGVTAPDAGTIEVAGETLTFRSTADALAHGIAIVLQEFNLLPDLTVAENISLTRPEGYRHGWWRSPRQQSERAAEVMASLGMDFAIDTKALVSGLSVAEQQIVEIVRALSVDARLFILDEPTAALGRQEVEMLLALIRRVREDGRSVIIVTHRLDEVYAVADRIVVLRDGLMRGEYDPSTPVATLIHAMVGRELEREMHEARTVRPPGELVLRVRGLTVDGSISDCSLEVRQGEVVGVAGLVGSGRTELVRAIFGADRSTSGQVELRGTVQSMTSPLAAVQAGVALVPEDRKTQGLHTALSIHDNIILSSLAKGGGFWPNRKRLDRQVTEKMQELGIKAGGPWLDASSLSGGNQQKVVLAKWLLAGPSLLILDEPTRGIDVGARAEFYRIIDTLVADGMAILMVSSEMQEVIALADRVLVMSGGRIVTELARDEVTEEKILAATEVGAGAHG